jgi:hypothetical protein
MAFDDVRNVSYKALIEHTQKVKPYRDSNGAYNLGARRYSDRHYRVRDNGVIDIFFSYMQNVKNKIKDGEDLYARHGRHIASIHPDNSIEIHKSDGQGDIQLLSAMLPYVTHSQVHHGLLIRSFARWRRPNGSDINVSHPVFRGGRYHLESHETMTPYVLQPRMVNRKLRKEVIARFDTFKKVGMTMLEPMTPHGIFEIYKELWSEYGESSMHEIQPELIVKLAQENKHVDAVLLSVLSKGDFGWWGMWKINQLMEDEKSGNFNPTRLNNFLGDTYKKSVREIYTNEDGKGLLDDLFIKGTPEAFHYKDPIPNGQAIPSSKWGYKLTDMSGNNLFRIK